MNESDSVIIIENKVIGEAENHDGSVLYSYFTCKGYKVPCRDISSESGALVKSEMNWWPG